MRLNRGPAGAARNRSRLSSCIVAEAAVWAFRLSGNDELTAEDRQRFQQWLRADPRHAAEFQAQATIRELARSLPADVRARWLASVEAHERSQSRLRRPWVWVGAGALVALVALIGAAWFGGWLTSAPANVYATRTGETRTIGLVDGSVAVLNTQTRLQWVGTTAVERRVLLLEGEAYFRVAHDTLRPFRVVVDHTTIQAVGTQFDVYRKAGGRVLLTVLEGAVNVTLLEPGETSPAWQRRIEAHQQIEYQGTQILHDVRSAHDDDLQWRQGAVRFREQPLSQVIEELQRYTDRRILIADPDLGQVLVGGLYSTRSVSTDLARIARFVPMVVHERDDTITLEHRETEAHDGR